VREKRLASSSNPGGKKLKAARRSGGGKTRGEGGEKPLVRARRSLRCRKGEKLERGGKGRESENDGSEDCVHGKKNSDLGKALGQSST